MKFWLFTLLALNLCAIPHSVHAFETEDTIGYHDLNELEIHDYQINVSDATRVQKFEAALEALGIPLETAPDFSNFVHANEVTQKEVEGHLPYVDPDNGLSRYLSMMNGNLQMFRDFFKSIISLDYLEYQQSLATDNSSIDSPDLINRLKAVAKQAQAENPFPLTGLKVLIDPGHMGGKDAQGNDWDCLTGKFVSASGGCVTVNGKRIFKGSRKVSEGSLTTWTALLTAKKLEALGATVMITREKLGTVSTEDHETYDTTPYVHTYFHNSMDDWMAPYLEKPIDEVRNSIKNASEVEKAYTEAQKLQFYIFGADLEARSRMVDTFQPDITLDIHFDASKSDVIQTTTQSLEAFVPGGFRKNETGGRKSKMMALKHLLEVRRWNQSVDLADHMTKSMSSALKIPRLNIPEAFTAIKVRDGVYARNLYIARRALSSLVVYLECLHYDYYKEHKRLSVLDRTGYHRGKSFNYPSRLDTISDSIQRGLVSYFKNMK